MERRSGIHQNLLKAHTEGVMEMAWKGLDLIFRDDIRVTIQRPKSLVFLCANDLAFLLKLKQVPFFGGRHTPKSNLGGSEAIQLQKDLPIRSFLPKINWALNKIHLRLQLTWNHPGSRSPLRRFQAWLVPNILFKAFSASFLTCGCRSLSATVRRVATASDACAPHRPKACTVEPHLTGESKGPTRSGLKWWLATILRYASRALCLWWGGGTLRFPWSLKHRILHVKWYWYTWF